jgi:Na+-translocating ferredoxin:NAD+ oxidoreductase subunit B
MDIFLPSIMLGVLGLVFGAGLAVASKKFCFATDPRLDEIFNRLPGVNCGACGMPGCMGFAQGLIKGTCTLDRCSVTEEKMRHQIARILGIEHSQGIKTTAVVHCHGGSARAKDKYGYRGVRDCRSAVALMMGPKVCAYGCVGFGTCAQVCPFGALSMNDENLPVVDETKCTSCGKCVTVCPRKLFSIVPVQKRFVVRCKSLDLGKKVVEACSCGCIACRKCEKACPSSAIKIINNLAVIDYALCDNKGECFKVCPTKAVARKENHRWGSRE